MKSLVFVLILLAQITAWGQAPTALTEAEKLFKSDQEEPAKKIVATYLTDNDGAPAYLFVGNLYARLKRWGDAVHYFEIATTRDPRNALAWYNLGLAHHQNKQVVEAVTALRKSLTISSKTPKSHLALGEILELAQERYEARNVYVAALRALGEKAEIRAKLCRLNFLDSFFKETIRECNKAVSLNAEDLVSWTILAKTYFDNQERDKSFQTFKKVIAKFPKQALPYRARGLIYFQERSYEQAANDLGKAFALDPFDDEGAIHLARAVFEMKNYDLAKNIYVEACRLNKEYRFEFLSKQRELLRLNKDEMASQYQEALESI